MNAVAAASLGKGPRKDSTAATTTRRRKRRRMLTGVSRQRRAANARERRRVHGVNDAFLQLRSILPVLTPSDVSKMDTLRLASKWIAHLTTVLIEHENTAQAASARHQTLPAALKDKLEELSTFEIEDFDLVENHDPDAYVYCDSAVSGHSEDIETVDFTDPDFCSLTSSPQDVDADLELTLSPDPETPTPSHSDLVFHLTRSPPSCSMVVGSQKEQDSFTGSGLQDWNPFGSTDCCYESCDKVFGISVQNLDCCPSSSTFCNPILYGECTCTMGS